MGARPSLELSIIAAVETVEAIANNTTDALIFEIGSRVGFEDMPTPNLAAAATCEFDLGDTAIARAVANVLATICRALNNLISGATGAITAALTALTDFIEPFLETLQNGIDGLISAITTSIADVVNTIATKFSETVNTIISTLEAVVGKVGDAVTAVVNVLRDTVGSILESIATVAETVVNKIADGFNALLAIATTVFDKIKSGISAILAALVRTVEDVFDRVGSALTTLINVLTGAAESGLARVRQVIEDIPTTLREIAEEAASTLTGVVGAPLSAMGTVIVTQVEEFFDRLIDDINASPRSILSDFLTGIGMPADEVDRIAGAADSAMPRMPALLAAAMAAMIPFLLAPVITTVLSPVLDQLRQEVAERVTPTLIPPADALDAFARGELSESALAKELGEAGFSGEKQRILLASSRRLVDVGSSLNWWLRGFISDEELDNTLQMLRIGPEDRSRLKLSAFPIPPVGDLITMAVREVFTPEVRERFGQDQDFPPEFTTFGAETGISDFWARAYWAAHWQLPSPAQGFEMLHRKVIESDDLELLLRSLDVMPFWREKLTQIAFRPLTRVDLRRMHALGLLTVEDLQIRYEALGFDADNAALMVAFTIEFNEGPSAEDVAELEGLTRGTIINLFEDGILNESETTDALLALGVSEPAAALLIQQRKLEVDRRDRKALIESVIQLVGGGAISLPQAQDSLATIGLTASEMAIAVRRILQARGDRDRVPTVAQLEKMRELKIVTEEEWTEAMGGLGFSDVWVERLLTLQESAG